MIIGFNIRRMLIRYTIRGEHDVVQEGVWAYKFPERGAYVPAARFNLEGRLLFLGTDTAKDSVVYVRLLQVR